MKLLGKLFKKAGKALKVLQRPEFRAGDNDIVLIYLEDEPLSFARIEDISPDAKAGWYHVKLLILQVPFNMVTWILKEAYISGQEFTMDGQKMRMERVVCPEESQDELDLPQQGDLALPDTIAANINEVVLIHLEDNPLIFARIEDISPDVKDDWYHVKLLILQIPLQVATWVLRSAYINGQEFTMDGKRMRMEQVICPKEFAIQEEKEIKVEDSPVTQLPPHPNTTFDKDKFLELLNATVSLSDAEKRQLIESIPHLSQGQIDQVIEILEEEKKKVASMGLTMDEARIMTQEAELGAEAYAISELLESDPNAAYSRAVANLKQAKQSGNDNLIMYCAFTFARAAQKFRPYPKLNKAIAAHHIAAE